jgi:hypothetical protein
MSSICAAPDTQMTKPGFADDTKTAAQPERLGIVSTALSNQVKFQQRYQKSHRARDSGIMGVHQMLTPLDSLLIRLFDRFQ